MIDWIKGLGHSEEEARQIEQGMADLVREKFRLPPDDDDSEARNGH